MKDKPYLVVNDGIFHFEVYTPEDEQKLMNWLYDFGLDLGDMYLSMGGTEYYNLKKLRGERK